MGTRGDYAYEISPHCYPFTPVELHAGYLLGQERILATHAGSYGWPGERCLARVLHFDKEGKRSGRDFATTITTEARTKVDLQEGEAIVLERLPVTVTPRAGEAKVQAVRCSAEGLSFEVESAKGVGVEVTTGELRLVGPLRLTVGEGAPRPVTPAGGKLSFGVPAGETSVRLGT